MQRKNCKWLITKTNSSKSNEKKSPEVICDSLNLLVKECQIQILMEYFNKSRDLLKTVELKQK